MVMSEYCIDFLHFFSYFTIFTIFFLDAVIYTSSYLFALVLGHLLLPSRYVIKNTISIYSSWVPMEIWLVWNRMEEFIQ